MMLLLMIEIETGLRILNEWNPLYYLAEERVFFAIFCFCEGKDGFVMVCREVFLPLLT